MKAIEGIKDVRDYLGTFTYGLRAKGCYTEARKDKEFYTETIYTLLDGILK